jgi:hypothetical protein
MKRSVMIRHPADSEANPSESKVEDSIGEIWQMLARINTGSGLDDEFSKLSVEDKILRTYEQLRQTAKQAGVTLPN